VAYDAIARQHKPARTAVGGRHEAQDADISRNQIARAEPSEVGALIHPTVLDGSVGADWRDFKQSDEIAVRVLHGQEVKVRR
jgi:hypothetical protein